MVDRKIIRIVDQYLTNLIGSGMDISFCVLFGSQATNKATESSDIDVLVVSNEFDLPFERSAVNRLWRVAARTDSRLEPIPVGLQAYSGPDTASAIIAEARRTGAVIKPRMKPRLVSVPDLVPTFEPSV